MADNDEVKIWSEHIADFVVDTLVDCGFVKTEDFEEASAAAAEEILVRLLFKDYPPSLSAKNS